MSVIAAIYVRISQDRGGEALGVARQEDDCRQLADSLGWTVAEVFSDNNVSAYSGKKRPAYERLLSAIQAGAVTGVLAWHPDRLHRSPLELERYIELIETRKVITQTVQSGSWDLSTPSGRAVARTLGAWARYESEHKGQRIARASHQRALAGKTHGGNRPYGYKKGGLEVDAAESAVVREAFEKTVAGVSLRQIVTDLNRRGIGTATGKRWTSQTLRDILVNPRYAGLRPHKGEPVAPAIWDGVVSEDVWRAARSIVSDPSRRTSPVGAQIRWLGSGLYYCGVCGGRELRCSATGSHQPAYRCKNRDYVGGGKHVVRVASKLDRYVEEVLVARLSAPDSLEAILGDPAKMQVDTSAVHIEQAAVRERLDELTQLFADGSISSRQLATGTEKLRARLDDLDAQIVTATTADPLAALHNAPDVAIRWFGTDTTPPLDLGSRRAILDSLLKVTVLPTSMRGGGAFDYDAIQLEWKS